MVLKNSIVLSYLFIFPLVYLSTCLSFQLFIFPIVYLSICLSFHLFIFQLVYLSTVYLSTCLSFQLFIFPIVYLSTCLSFHLFIFPPCLSFHFSYLTHFDVFVSVSFFPFLDCSVLSDVTTDCTEHSHTLQAASSSTIQEIPPTTFYGIRYLTLILLMWRIW